MTSQKTKLLAVFAFLFLLSVPSSSLAAEKKETTVANAGSSLAEKTKAYDTALAQPTKLLKPESFFEGQKTIQQMPAMAGISGIAQNMDVAIEMKRQTKCAPLLAKDAKDLSKKEKKEYKICEDLTSKKFLLGMKKDLQVLSSGLLSDISKKAATVGAEVNKEAAARASLLYAAAMRDRDSALQIIKEEYVATSEELKSSYEKKSKKVEKNYKKRVKKLSKSSKSASKKAKKEKKLLKKFNKKERTLKKAFAEESAVLQDDYKTNLDSTTELYDKRLKEVATTVSGQQAAAIGLVNQLATEELKAYRAQVTRAEKSLRKLSDGKVVAKNKSSIAVVVATSLPSPPADVATGATK